MRARKGLDLEALELEEQPRLVGAMEAQSLVSSFLGAAPNTSAERFDLNGSTYGGRHVVHHARVGTACRVGMPRCQPTVASCARTARRWVFSSGLKRHTPQTNRKRDIGGRLVPPAQNLKKERLPLAGGVPPSGSGFPRRPGSDRVRANIRSKIKGNECGERRSIGALVGNCPE